MDYGKKDFSSSKLRNEHFLQLFSAVKWCREAIELVSLAPPSHYYFTCPLTA